MKPREYCCCAIPILYSGIYATLIEQFALGIIAGTLSVATPAIVGASTPSFAKWIFTIICYVGAGIQVLGLFAVFSERPTLFRRYTTLHLIITVAAFAVAAVWVILSATRHTEAQTACESEFYGANASTDGEATTLCNVFPWVDIGLMSGLWVLLAIMQLYLYTVLASYSSALEQDSIKYDTMFDATPLKTRDAWESRPLAQENNTHGRSDSVGSVATVIADKPQEPATYANYGDNGGYPPSHPDSTYTGGIPPARDSYYDRGY